ncbi:hypothetical protein [Burkholderia gladioli]|uniref:hypothetical protein n=1 Tax=Burkholderia gladioli TaxID=28095 RepID=UPI001FC8D2D2|nr:hypothetical protein [Burkholderia gladioli]
MSRLIRSADAAQTAPDLANRTDDRSFDARAARAALPGPVWSSGRPVVLSAFRPAAGDGSVQAWSRVLGTMLAGPPSLQAAELDALMRRVLGARATAGAHDFPALPPDFPTDRGDTSAPCVLLIDERQRGPDRHAGGARERERGFARLLDAARSTSVSAAPTATPAVRANANAGSLGCSMPHASAIAMRNSGSRRRATAATAHGCRRGTPRGCPSDFSVSRRPAPSARCCLMLITSTCSAHPRACTRCSPASRSMSSGPRTMPAGG